MSTRPEIPRYLNDRLMLVAKMHGKPVTFAQVPAPIDAIERLKKDGFFDAEGEPTEKGRLAVGEIARRAVEFGRPTTRYPVEADL